MNMASVLAVLCLMSLKIVAMAAEGSQNLALQVQLHSYENKFNLKYLPEKGSTPYCCCANGDTCFESADDHNFTVNSCITQCSIRFKLCTEVTEESSVINVQETSASPYCYESMVGTGTTMINFVCQPSTISKSFFPSQEAPLLFLFLIESLSPSSGNINLTVTIEEMNINPVEFDEVDKITIPVSIYSQSEVATSEYIGIHGIASVTLGYTFTTITNNSSSLNAVQATETIILTTTITIMNTVTEMVQVTVFESKPFTSNETAASSSIWMPVSFLLISVAVVSVLATVLVITTALFLMKRKEQNQAFENNNQASPEAENSTCLSCDSMYQLCRDLVLSTDQIILQCLSSTGQEPTDSEKLTEVYAFGFLMVLLVALGSLAGVIVVPLLNSKSKRVKIVYEYVHVIMIAVGVAALLSDAILHLIPKVFGATSNDHLWKGSVVLVGLYGFFMVETTLHTLGESVQKEPGEQNPSSAPMHGHHHQSHSPEEPCTQDQAKELDKVDEKSSEEVPVKLSRARHICNLCRGIKPVAWLIIIGDAIHNFADGMALGASAVVSIPLAVSTTIAEIFHEVPHELSDYVILIGSGIHWITALLLNFLSSLTAVVGFFVGVSVSTASDTANEWILSFAAGLFIYIALTDLLPEIIHRDESSVTATGWKWWLRFLFINIAMLITYVIILLLAVYEENLEHLI